MEPTVQLGSDGRGAGCTDEVMGDDMYQLFVEKLAALTYIRQTYCPDDEVFGNRLVPDFRIFLERLGIMRADLDSLSCIHVSGTKGKGSTCAMTESILRTYGYKTGFISSPPLLEIRERVRINGVPVSRAMFGRHGLECFDLLEKNKARCGQTFTDSETPGPYSIFTLVAYYILVKEKIDVAVVEVGLGGEYDSTNVLWSPTVTGVSSLAIEHVSLLGHTLEKITWHKAGIFKDGRPALTVPQQEEAMKVLVQRADERNAPLQVCPPLVDYECHGNKVKLGLAGKHQRTNAALAVQLTKVWLQNRAPERFKFEAFGPHIEKCKCNGINDNATTDDELNNGNVRQASAFVLPDEFLRDYKVSMTLDEELLKCEQHLATFKQLYGERCKEFCNTSSVTPSQDGRCDGHPMPIFKVSPSATEALRWAVGPRVDHDDDMVDEHNTEMMDRVDGEEDLLGADHLQVLVTGSNFIVGSVIHVIDPHMFNKI